MMDNKLILAGNTCRKKQQFLEYLTGTGSRNAAGYTVSEDLQEADETSCVLLFADPDKSQALDELLAALLHLAKVHPYRAALLSDTRVHGVLFGAERMVGEHTIGYACHTRSEERPVTDLRAAEHFACRLAREEGLDIRVLRDGYTQQEGEAKRMEAALELLFTSEKGQVYNLPGVSAGRAGAPSPLSPLTIKGT